jgi:protein SCO1/2
MKMDMSRVVLRLLLAALLAWHFGTMAASLYQTPMRWTDDEGQSVALSQWQGKPMVITMAYSTCRKFCPMTLQRLLEIQRLYDQHNIDAEFVVISYDPQNDTWQAWADYRKKHHLERKNWHFLTGASDDTKAISELLEMDYWLYDEHVMHNFKIVLLGTTGIVEKTLGWENQKQVEAFLPESPPR